MRALLISLLALSAAPVASGQAWAQEAPVVTAPVPTAPAASPPAPAAPAAPAAPSRRRRLMAWSVIDAS
jgi:hypothetical protein